MLSERNYARISTRNVCGNLQTKFLDPEIFKYNVPLVTKILHGIQTEERAENLVLLHCFIGSATRTLHGRGTR